MVDTPLQGSGTKIFTIKRLAEQGATFHGPRAGVWERGTRRAPRRHSVPPRALFFKIKKHIIFGFKHPSEFVRACYRTPSLALNHLYLAYFEVVDVRSFFFIIIEINMYES